jgi:hypothetical protein
MRRKWFFLIPLFIALFIVVGGEVVMHLWNWLIPSLVGWGPLTFWKAVGLLALCRILFGGLGGRGTHRSNFRRRMGEKWERMSPEDREKFQQNMRARCGDFASRANQAGSGANEPA